MATSADYQRLGAWAKLLNPSLNIDRHGCHRKVPMEVLSLGFPRTGTLSMQEAYSILGYSNPYHYSSIFENVQDTDMWQEAISAKYHGGPQVDWREHFDGLLGHCSAVTDVPCAMFWQELVLAYPEAKIVIVERDVDKWFPSCCVLLSGILDPFLTYVLRVTDPFWVGKIINCGRAWIQVLFGSKNLEEAKRNAKTAYRKHYADIRACVPEDRLLDYRLGSGWEPLCTFLGKDVPEVSFPKRNEAKTLESAFHSVASKALKNSLFNMAIVVGAVVGLGGLVRTRFL